MKVKGKIDIDKEFCKGCRLCVEFCPKKVIDISEALNGKGYNFACFMQEAGCTGCATCALVCPEAAIEVYRG